MARIVLYHNPACSKSRGAKQILAERDVDFDTVEYLKTPLDEAELRRILDVIDDPPAELVRKDAHFRELGLSAENYVTADAVVNLLLEHPKLMQRPVVLRGDRGVIGRPSENVEKLL